MLQPGIVGNTVGCGAVVGKIRLSAARKSLPITSEILGKRWLLNGGAFGSGTTGSNATRYMK